MCGEKTTYSPSPPSARGSPPRVRGKDVLDRDRVSQLGITPACAGKSRAISAFPSAIQDHPRVCGEKTLQGVPHGPLPGSPPRVRGKEVLAFIALALFGITPACAGKRKGHGRMTKLLWDHPRVCGEKPGISVMKPTSSGSPPRVRGKAEMENMWGNGQRITPACAGKRRSEPRCEERQKDHPRVCGEKLLSSSSVWSLTGSPPRVRGKVG